MVCVLEEIVLGDYEMLFKGLCNNLGIYLCKLFLLNSIGGSVLEVICMGCLLCEFGFDVLVLLSSVCQGICVYLLVVGKCKIVCGYVGLYCFYYVYGDLLYLCLVNGMCYDFVVYFCEMDIFSILVQVM